MLGVGDILLCSLQFPQLLSIVVPVGLGLGSVMMPIL